MACETTSGQHAQQDQSVQRYKAVQSYKTLQGQRYKDLDCNFARHRLQGQRYKDLDCNFARHSLRLIEIGDVSHIANTRLVSRHTCVEY